MSSNFKLDIISPNRKFYNGMAKKIIIRTVEGDMGIMDNHQPMVVPLGNGVIKIETEEKSDVAILFGGFCQVDHSGSVSIITEKAEWAHEIDLNRALEAKKRAEERLRERRENVDFNRAKAALERAIARINATNHNLGGD